MSVYRTITRMAAVTAFNNFMQEPWPTLAGPHVFDSKIEPVEDIKHDVMFPCVVVYTDYDKDHWAKSGRVHEDRILSLTLELLVVQTEQANDGTYKLECPFADSEIETTLDALEHQVFRALTANTISSDAFNYICPAYVNITSRRGATVEGGIRLAARQISVEMKAIREPALGSIPEAVGVFLNRLETFDDYKDRVDDIRSLLTANSALTSAEVAARMLGYTRSLADRLGAPVGPVSPLGSPITYHFDGVSP